MSMTNIESVLHESRKFAPPAAFTAAARIQPADFAALRAEAERLTRERRPDLSGRPPS